MEREQDLKALIRMEMWNIVRRTCDGCIYDEPSQRYHSYCLIDCKKDHQEILEQALDNLLAQNIINEEEYNYYFLKFK